MSRNIIAIIGLLGFACLFAAVAIVPAPGRTLANGELWNAFGGAYVADRCCVPIPQCEGATSHCDAMNGNQIGCSAQQEVVNFGTHNKLCGMFQPVSPCTEGATMTCRTITQCTWDPPTMTCKIGTFVVQTNSSPETCNPDCGG